MEKIINLYLRARYNMFRPGTPDKTFEGRKLLWSKTDFRTMEGLSVHDDEFYNEHNVYFSKKAVSGIYDGKLRIKLYYDRTDRTTWQGRRTTDWTSGMVTTELIPGARVWEITARLPKLWPAIWLLRKTHRNNDGIDTITPEVDIMEVIRGNFQHTVHYKPEPAKYSTKGFNNHVRYDNDWHTYAVELLPNGYDFYIDGILTGRFRGKPDSVSDAPCYLLLNNAVQDGERASAFTSRNDMYVSSIKVYE